MIVTTELVAPDVKDYFTRIEPQAEAYVERVEGLPVQLERIVTEIRTRRPLELLGELDTLPTLKFDMAGAISMSVNQGTGERPENRWRCSGEIAVVPSYRQRCTRCPGSTPLPRGLIPNTRDQRRVTYKRH